MIDHDALSAMIRRRRKVGAGGLLPELPAAYLDLYDEVKRLRATGEIDRKFARKTADDVVSWKSRAEKAEAERDRFEAALGRACQVGGTTYLVERAEKAEAERDALRAALERCPPTSNPTLSAEYNLECIEAWWRLEVRPVLAKP